MGVLLVVFCFVLVFFFGVWMWLRQKLATAAPVGVQPPSTGGLASSIEFLRNPTAFLQRCRAKLGDVFVLNLFGLRLFFVFSAQGLEDFYRVKESDASFTEATRGFLGVKVPEEIMSGSMSTIHRVLKKDFQNVWKGIFSRTMMEAVEALGPSGEMDVFGWTKGVAHKAGFRSWIGEEAVEDEQRFKRLIHLFEEIDPEVAFTHMGSLAWTLLTRRARERRAFLEIVDILSHILRSRTEPAEDFLEALAAEFAGEPTPMVQVASQICAIHLASQSNLFAAISWTVVQLVQHPEPRRRLLDEVEAVRLQFGNDFFAQPAAKLPYLEQCYYESIRLAQQSLTLRLVLKPIHIEHFTVVPGYYIATLLSCLNTSPALLSNATAFEPTRYERGRLAELGASQVVVSTFGHGPHACPGRQFALAAAKAVVGCLFASFDLKPLFSSCDIIPSQMGAVGRPINPPFLKYTLR